MKLLQYHVARLFVQTYFFYADELELVFAGGDEQLVLVFVIYQKAHWFVCLILKILLFKQH